MLLQISIVPPPNIFGPLVALGQGLGQIFNPRGQQRQAFLDLLASQPQILTQFRIAQEQAEELAAKEVPTTAEAQAAADITAPPPTDVERRFRPNVLAAFGFELEEAEAIFRASPETLEQARAAEARKLGLAELQARTDFAKAQAEGIVAQGVLTQGIPALRLEVLKEEATVEAALAKMRTKEFQVYESILKKLPPQLRNLLTFAEFAPKFAELLTKISIEDARTQVASAKEGIDLANATFKLANSYDEAITKKIQQCRDAEGDKQALRLCIQQVNEMSRRRLAEVPNTTHTVLAIENERWLFRHKIQLRVFGPSDMLAGVQNAFVPRVSRGLSVDDAVAEMIENETTRTRWFALTDEEREIWKVQLEANALVQAAEEQGAPITPAEQAQLEEAASKILREPSLARDIAIIMLTFGKIGRGIGVVVGKIGEVLALPLEEIRTARELIEFLNTPQGQAALRKLETENKERERPSGF